MWDDPVLYDLENADDPAFDLAFWSGLLSSLRPSRVLELASGTGRLTLPLARLGIASEIVGLDYSPAFVAAARLRLDAEPPADPSRAADTTKVSFVEGDMRSASGVVSGPFDLVAIPFNSLAYVQQNEFVIAMQDYDWADEVLHAQIGRRRLERELGGAAARNAAAAPVWERYQSIVAQWAVDHAGDAEWWADFVADASAAA